MSDTKIKISLADPHVKAVWDSVLAAKREVESWPAWKRGDDVAAASPGTPASSTGHPLSQADFDSIYARVPRLCVEVIMVEPDGVVLTKRAIAPGAGLWHIPGATLRFGETLADAAHRVAQEECGVAIEGLEQLGVVEYVFAEYPQWPVSVVYLARPLTRRYRHDRAATDVHAFKVPDGVAQLAIIEQHRTLLLEHAARIGRMQDGSP
jgi:ADP-ribose pyrophosphatase YjhB (NUDIX family)